VLTVIPGPFYLLGNLYPDSISCYRPVTNRHCIDCSFCILDFQHRYNYNSVFLPSPRQFVYLIQRVIEMNRGKRTSKLKHTIKLNEFKGGKRIKNQKISVPVRYQTPQHQQHQQSSASCSSNVMKGGLSLESMDHGQYELETQLSAGVKTSKLKVKFKKKIQTYHAKKSRLAESWLSSREGMLRALLSSQCLPVDQGCVIASCANRASSRCQQCGPAYYLCAEHVEVLHAGGRTLHQPEDWKVCFTHMNTELKYCNIYLTLHLPLYLSYL